MSKKKGGRLVQMQQQDMEASSHTVECEDRPSAELNNPLLNDFDIARDISIDFSDLNIDNFAYKKKPKSKQTKGQMKKTQELKDTPKLKEEQREIHRQHDIEKINVNTSSVQRQPLQKQDSVERRPASLTKGQQPNLFSYFSVQKPNKSGTPQNTAFSQEKSSVQKKASEKRIETRIIEEQPQKIIDDEFDIIIETKQPHKAQTNDNQDKKPAKSYSAMFKKKEEPVEQQKSKVQPKKVQYITGNMLAGKTIVLTGIINKCSREDLETQLKLLGAKITGSVSGKTSYLIAGEILEDSRPVEQGAKFKMASEKGTRIIKEAQLPQWFEDYTGYNFDDVFGDNEIGQLYQESQRKAQKLQLPKGNMWADQYAPTCLPELVGQKSNVDRMYKWLKNWGKKRTEEEKQNKDKKFFSRMPTGTFRVAGDKYSKACLISGPPGLGKSSAIRLLAEVMGYQTLITNSSEQRNKSSVKSQIGGLIGNKLLFSAKMTEKFIIIMDEVDGMSGSDRGGIAQLIECIKHTQVPIVCICNDHDSTKLRSLLAHCYHINFVKPTFDDVVKRVLLICEREKLEMNENQLKGVASTFGQDLRQIINFLQLMSYKQSNDQGQVSLFSKDKVAIFNVFEGVLQLMNKESRRGLRLRELLDLFFLDYDLVPLFIQDNYLNAIKMSKQKNTQKQATKKKGKKDQTEESDKKETQEPQYSLQDIENMAKASSSLALGDIFNKQIRRHQNWSLMQSYGQSCLMKNRVVSTVIPSEAAGHQLAYPKFPEFFGKLSSRRKIIREGRSIKYITSAVTFYAGDKAIRLEYAPALLRLFDLILRKKFTRDDSQSIISACTLLENYNLTPEDMKTQIHDLIFNPDKINQLGGIDGPVKAALTKKYIQRHQVIKLKDKKPKQKFTEQISTAQNQVYNPALGEEGPVEVEVIKEDRNSADEQSQEVSPTRKKQKSKAPPKPKQQQQKKKKIQRESEEDSINDSDKEFIDDDDDE